jgi:4-amino-4-deoxy-L-arabinose transferase-like glycosyltransferase
VPPAPTLSHTNQVELLMGALRQRTPGAAIILLSPMLQSCTRGLKIPRWKPYNRTLTWALILSLTLTLTLTRWKPFHTIPTDAAGTRQVLAKCYRNDTVSAAFEDSGAAHSITTVSIRNLLRRRLWARPDDAAALVHRAR